MLNAHYNGEIDLSTIWSVGDTRTIHINAISATSEVSESYKAQDVTFVIIGFNHDKLKTKSGTKTKAAVTLQCKEILKTGYYWGTSTLSGELTNYSTNPRRTWFNNDFVNALPETFSPLIKTVVKKNLSDHRDTPSSIDTEDKSFFISYSEILGDTPWVFYEGSQELEGNQYEYFKIEENRKKKDTWWLRSPSSYYSSALKSDWCRILDSGTYDHQSADRTDGICPAFCL